jgi:CRP-like cAMP-binding protein
MPYYPRTSAKLLEILKSGRVYKLRPGQIIQSTEDRRVFNLVKEGYIKRYLVGTDGTLGVQVLYGPGDIFPITLAFHTLFGMDISETKEVYYYEAMTDAEIYSIWAEELTEQVNANPLLYRDLMIIAGKRLHSTLNGLENVTLDSAYKRIAHELAYIGRRFGAKKAKGKSVKILVPITNKDIADLLSLRGSTVSAGITKLRRKGLVKIDSDKNFCIPDMAKLMEEALS